MVLQDTAKGTYQSEHWHCPRLCSSSHHPENCLEKGCPSISKPGTPMPGSGSRAHPCLVLDHKLVCLGLVTLCGPESEADTVLAAEDTG